MKLWSKAKISAGNQTKVLEDGLALVERIAETKGWSPDLRQKHMECLVKLWKQIRLKEQNWKLISRVSCDVNKAPGPDVLNLNFFKANWESIKEDYMKFLHEFYRDGSVVKFLNGLKINFHKSCLVKVVKKRTFDEGWAATFRCTKSFLPITYLGLPQGGNLRKEAFWNPVISKVEQRLAPWKKGFTFKGGRLIMIKAVLLSLPTYFMSVFNIHVVVAKRIEKLQMVFFWNDGLVKKKVHMVD
ncbi:hypothetical protein Dsin_021409 [Dipteronia sinensis]|uniref:Uncharacterized protein n=1 Tax=Dipteronia sinensis TaxID=43782 RepID=A0AAE0DZ27_9ROSI|nr:hypothetical protein Dsin_021409 [Dipteronia sinensis]